MSALPIPGTSLLAKKIDLSTMDFVVSSAPVIQGQQTLTINSDNLSTASSFSSGLATTVLPVRLLRSLSETVAANGAANGSAAIADAMPNGTAANGAAATMPPVAAPARVQPVSPTGIDFLKEWEAFREKPTNDLDGACTIGYGSVLHSGPCDGRPIEQPHDKGITKEAAAQLLGEQCNEVRQLINDMVTKPLNQPQSDALISFVHNVGGDAFRKSTLLTAVNAGDMAGAAAEIRKWTKAAQNGGAVTDVPQLVKRREAEAAAFERPAAVTQGLSRAHSYGRPNFSRTHSYCYNSPSQLTERPRYAYQQNPAALIAGIEIADAISIGLAGVAIVQTQFAASQGSFSLAYDKAQRLLAPEARASMQGSQTSKKSYSTLLFHFGIGRLGTAKADVIIEWEGNPYGEIGTAIIRRNLSSSTEWSKSSANISITKVDRIPLPKTDPRAWPIVYSYEGTFDPMANGYFELSGEFEINAFGGLKFNRHEVVSRSLADWALGGTPEGKVQRGNDITVAVPEIPQEQIANLRTRLP